MFGDKDPQAGGGISGLGTWRFRTEIVAPPASGQIRFNNADPALATLMWIHETSTSGTDMANFLNLVSSGDVFYIQDKTESSRFIVVQVSSNTDSGTYRTFGISQIVVEGTAMGQNTQVALVISGEGFVNAAATYLRLDATNGPLTGPLVSQQISPDTDQTRDLGTTTNKFGRAFAGIGVFAKGNVNTAVTFPSNANHGGLIAGTIVGAGGTEQMILNNATYPAIACIGNVKAPVGGNASLEATRGGAIAMGSAFAYNSGTSNPISRLFIVCSRLCIRERSIIFTSEQFGVNRHRLCKRTIHIRRCCCQIKITRQRILCRRIRAYIFRIRFSPY